MSRRSILISCILLVGSAVARADGEPTQGLRSPGELQALRIETGRTVDGAFILDGPDAAQQLVVTGHYASGQERDLTRDVSYEARPDGVADVSPTGVVLPRGDGTATITA